MKLFRSKLSGDIAWTTGSFVVLAASGLLINLVIAYFRTAADLGVFNIAYSFYIIVSQIAAFGIHYSVLRHAALHDSDRDELGTILASAMVPVVLLGVFFAAVIFWAEPFFESAFGSERAARAIAFAALGIALFPATKVLISFLNALRHMKAFAVLQAGRYIAVAVVVTVFAVSEWDFTLATLCFLIAELLTLLGAITYIIWMGLIGRPRVQRRWLRTHVSFGGRSLAAGMFGEINTRVDVLCLGLFLSDREVGIYSFAAMLLDGLYHLLAMVRVNFNPILVGALRDGRWSEAQRILRLSKRFAPLVMGGLAIGVFIFYWIVTVQFVPERGLQEGMTVLFILLAGLVVTAGFIPFDNLLLVSGHPMRQTLQQAFAVMTNVALNLALIPVLGIEGAAIGTASSYLAAITALWVMSNRQLGWNIMTNRVRVGENSVSGGDVAAS